MRAAALVLLAGCGGGGGDGTGLSASLYQLPPGLQLVFAPTDLLVTTVPGDPPVVSLEAVDAGWELRSGDDWEAGTVTEDFAVDTSSGLRVDDTLWLPAFFTTGQKEEGTEVVAAGDPVEVYYGTFDPAVAVEVAEGRWAGSQVLAQDFGPVRFTLDGTSWDLVTYVPAP